MPFDEAREILLFVATDRTVSLVKVLDEYLEHSGMFRAVWPASQHSSPKLRAFVDHMAERLFPKVPP
jgi:DNA-binding transcriptional LysR family regulator